MNRRSFLAGASGLAATAPLLCRCRLGAQTAAPNPALERFKLGAISDEFSPQLEQALELMHAGGLRWVELRNVWGVYNTDTTPQQQHQIKDLLQRYDFRVSVIDSALFKCALPGTRIIVRQKDPYPYTQQMELLKRAIDRAHSLGAEKIRVFAFWRTARPKEHAQRIADELATAADKAQNAGLRLVLENESACNVATGHELARMLKRVNALNLGANWDIGNGWWEGERSYPDGYSALDKSSIWHMHLKDVHCGTTAASCQTVVVGEGQNDLVGQLRALLRDNYQGTMSLEPEVDQPGMSHQEATQRSLVALLAKMNEALQKR